LDQQLQHLRRPHCPSDPSCTLVPMLSLFVRSLDGTRRQIDLAPETTIANLVANVRAGLEQQLPAFHEVRLLHGGQELADGGAVEVELQAITMPAPAKAVTELERLIPELELSGRVPCHPKPEVKQGVLAATKGLCEMPDMSLDIGERFFRLLPKSCYSWKSCGDIFLSLAAAFGRKCGDPSTYVSSLVSMVESVQHITIVDGVFCPSHIALVAWAEIAERSEDTVSVSLRKPLLRWASWALTTIHFVTLRLPYLYRLLGLFGDDEHAEKLRIAINSIEFPSEATTAAAEALHLLCSRSSKEVGCAAASHDLEDDEATGTEEDQNHIDGNGSAVAGQGIDAETHAGDDRNCIDRDSEAVAGQHSDVETDPQLDAVLSASEQEVLLLYQQHLQETILKSKADCMSGTGSLEHTASTVVADDRLVLLSFNRRPKELFDALLTSPLALRIIAAGEELHPKWAGGKLILAEGVTEAAVSEAREAWHVAVRAADEGAVDATLRSVLGRERPRVKALDGRILVPQGTSLFQVSIPSVAGGARSRCGTGLTSDWADLVLIRRTFIDILVEVTTLPRASASAPAEL